MQASASRAVPVRAAAHRARAYRRGGRGAASVSTAARRAFSEVKKVRKNSAPIQSSGSIRLRKSPKLQGEKGAVWDTPRMVTRRSTCQP